MSNPVAKFVDPLLTEGAKLPDEVIQHAVARLPNNGGDPDRPKILANNQEFRKERFGGVPGDWGYVALNIPVPDMRILQARFPDLTALDPQIQHNAWQKFIRSPESAPYKVRRNDGRRMPNTGIIVR